MSTHGALGKRGRALEDDWKDQELLEKMRPEVAAKKRNRRWAPRRA